MRLTMEEYQSQTADSCTETSAENTIQPSLESLSRKVEIAEAAIRDLEAENRQLRHERTQAVLAAANTRQLGEGDQGPEDGSAKQRFEGLTNGMKIAEAARREAARERKSAIRAVEEALRQEYAERIKAIQEHQATELATLSRTAAKRARDEVANQLGVLSGELADARQALQAARRDHDKALRKIEDALVQKYSRQIEELDRSHAENVEKLSRLHKEQFAEALMSSVSEARAAWQKDTKKQLQRARSDAAKGAARDIARVQRRSRVFIRRAARAWRARERRRLADARSEWLNLHRQTLAINDRRWRTRFGRLKRWARHVRWLTEYWRRQKGRIATILMTYDRIAKDAFEKNDDSTPSPIPGGIMALVLLFLGVSFSLPDMRSTPNGVVMSATTPAQAAMQRELASLPRDSAKPGTTTSHMSTRTSPDRTKVQRSTGPVRPPSHSEQVDSAFTSNTPREVQPIQRLQVPRSNEKLAAPSAKLAFAPSDDRMSDEMLRERLERSIRTLRAAETTY